MDKIAQRIECLNRRKSYAYKESANKLVYEEVLKISADYDCIAIYVSKDDEVDTIKLIVELLRKSKKILVPKCRDKDLSFHQITGLCDLVLGKFNVLEPITDEVDVDEAKIMFIPVVAFDDEFHRLGYGKGYYDRTLSNYTGLKIGLAYSCSKVKQVIVENHDISLHSVIHD